MQLSDATFGWNELDFLDEAELRQMGPTIVRLEVDRLDKILQKDVVAEDLNDRIRRAKFELDRFSEELATVPTLPDSGLSSHLSVAMLNLGFDTDGIEEATAKEIRYVTGRLSYILNRMSLIY